MKLYLEKISCKDCINKNLCLFNEFPDSFLNFIKDSIVSKIKYKKGDSLFGQNERMNHFFAIYSGAFKSIKKRDEDSQVIGFHMSGEILGIDGIYNDFYQSETVALEDSIVCFISLKHLKDLAPNLPELYGLLMRRIVKIYAIENYDYAYYINSQSSEKKIAKFILGQSDKYKKRGYSEYRFSLTMNRLDISNYLGLRIETVSRELTKMKQAGIIKINQKDIEIENLVEMKNIANF